MDVKRMTKKTTIQQLVAQLSTARYKQPSEEEHRIQASCVRWFNLKYHKLKGRLFAVPNGGKRDAHTAAKLKKEGVVPGVADLILLVPNKFYGALLIEMKTSKGKQSELQKQWERIITERGEYVYVICHSLDEFIKEVEHYLKDY